MSLCLSLTFAILRPIWFVKIDFSQSSHFAKLLIIYHNHVNTFVGFSYAGCPSVASECNLEGINLLMTCYVFNDRIGHSYVDILISTFNLMATRSTNINTTKSHKSKSKNVPLK